MIGAAPVVNHALIAQLAKETDRIALVTNQGGLGFGWQQRNRADGRKYPAPADFVQRLGVLVKALAEAGIRVDSVHVSLYHHAHETALLIEIRSELGPLAENATGVYPKIYIIPDSRKPFPKMLYAAHATVYYGDSDEDEQAAQAAGCRFVRVPRFFTT